MPVERGDKVAVITRSLCRYEGNYLSMNVDKQTFTLCNVRAYGTENRTADEYFPGAQDTYECVEFKAGDVQDLKVVDFHDLRDPAIVNLSEHRQDNTYERGPLQYLRGSARESNNRGRPFIQGNRPYGGGNPHRSFRNEWIGVGSQGDGSFPRKNPGALGNSLEEFDFEKGIEEFTQIKLNESIEKPDPEKQSPDPSPEKKTFVRDECSYDKQKSFFDNLSGASSIASRKQQPRERSNNPNIETFGLDTVQQLYEIRRYSNDQRNGYRNREGFRRYNNRSNGGTGSHGSFGSSGRPVRQNVF